MTGSPRVRYDIVLVWCARGGEGQARQASGSVAGAGLGRGGGCGIRRREQAPPPPAVLGAQPLFSNSTLNRGVSATGRRIIRPSSGLRPHSSAGRPPAHRRRRGSPWGRWLRQAPARGREDPTTFHHATTAVPEIRNAARAQNQARAEGERNMNEGVHAKLGTHALDAAGGCMAMAMALRMQAHHMWRARTARHGVH